MIGNDIVDLILAKEQSNWKRPRFLNKIFTSKEQKYIADAVQPDKMVWLLWSMKESAYKLHVQRFGRVFFAPKKFQCSLVEWIEESYFGEVHCFDFQYFTQSFVSETFVHTIAKSKENLDFFSDTFPIDDLNCLTQSNSVYHKILTYLSDETGISANRIFIHKNESNVPQIFVGKAKTAHSISMSHHGRFGAFAISKPN